jgi:hypothetical protein
MEFVDRWAAKALRLWLRPAQLRGEPLQNPFAPTRETRILLHPPFQVSAGLDDSQCAITNLPLEPSCLHLCSRERHPEHRFLVRIPLDSLLELRDHLARRVGGRLALEDRLAPLVAYVSGEVVGEDRRSPCSDPTLKLRLAARHAPESVVTNANKASAAPRRSGR